MINKSSTQSVNSSRITNENDSLVNTDQYSNSILYNDCHNINSKRESLQNDSSVNVNDISQSQVLKEI